MSSPSGLERYQFGVFEADASTGELRRQGVRIKLNAQPFQVLLLLLERAGELLTREEIARELWPEGTFVDYEHGVNSAMNRIREALGDTARNPRFVETLARKGYRFIAPVQRSEAAERQASPASSMDEAELEPGESFKSQEELPQLLWAENVLASQKELPKVSVRSSTILFGLLQAMYLAFYIGTLANLPEVEDLLSALPYSTVVFIVTTLTASVLIPLRAFVLTAVLFRAPGQRVKFLRMWPFLFPMDELWSLAPFLLLHHIHVGVALACTALLVYAPFAQRSLVLMGAGEEKLVDA